jgi:PKD repeat protein
VPTSENCTTSSFNYVWTFGDNSSSVTTTQSTSPAHTYSLAGNYSPSVQITDSVSGASSSATTSIKVTGETLTVGTPTFTSPATTCQPVTFSVSSLPGSNCGTSPTFSYSWSFGDGQTSTLASPTHQYTAAKTYQGSVFR